MQAKPDFELSSHARDMLTERGISEEWLWQTIESFDIQERGADGNLHYMKSIRAKEDRILRVIVNDRVTPYKIVTVFFDRRMSRRDR